MIAIFDRISIRMLIVGAGVFGGALALSPGVALAGGSECLLTSAGGAPAATACAPISEMAGVPMALPGPVAPLVPLALPPVPPVIPPVPLALPPAPPVPLLPPVSALAQPLPPVSALASPLLPPVPLADPAAGGLPLTAMSGVAGKGDSTGLPTSGAPAPGQPILPGPGASGGN